MHHIPLISSAQHWLIGLAVWVICFGVAHATTYYMASNGNDTYNGTQPDSAWQTLTHLSNITLAPGDSVLFHAGDVFAGTYNASGAGNALAPIFIGTYGGAQLAVISGGEPVSNWSSTGNGVWTAPFNDAAKGLWVNGKLQTIARFPNTGFLWINGSLGSAGLICNALTQADSFWNGATVRTRTNDHFYDIRRVANFSGGQITFDQPASGAQQIGYGFYLDNKLSLLDTIGEWYCDTVDHLIYYKPPVGVDPNTETAMASVYANGIQFSNYTAFVNISHIACRYQVVNGLSMAGANQISIRNCAFDKSLGRGISLSGYYGNVTVVRDTFSDLMGSGFTVLQMSNGIVDSSEFRSIGVRAGYGTGDSWQGIALATYGGSSTHITFNRFDSTGFCAVAYDGHDDTIAYNIMRHCMLVQNNLGIISNYGSLNYNTVYHHNIISDAVGNCESCSDKKPIADGIYMLFDCHDLTFESNTISNMSDCGMLFWSKNKNHKVANNVVYNCQLAQLCWRDIGSDSATQTGNILQHNILYCLSATQRNYLIQANHDTMVWASSDSNYLVNPYNYAVSHPEIMSNNSYVILYDYTLPEWNNAVHEETHSIGTYFTYRQYATTDTVGTDLLVNGDFTNNYDHWDVSPDSILDLLLDNNTPMDEGCAKTAFTKTNAGRAQLNSEAFATVPNQLYQLSFSVLGAHNGFANPVIYESGGNYQPNGYNVWFHTNAERKDILDYAKIPASQYAQQFKFSRAPSDSLMWFDNIHLFPVNGYHLDSTFFSRLLVNATGAPVTYSFGDSIFFNLDSVQVSSVTLQPFTSTVLCYQGIPTYIASVSNVSSLHVFPTPADDALYVRLEQGMLSSYRLYNLSGALVQSGLLHGNMDRIGVKHLSSGMYILETWSAQGTAHARVSVVH